MARSKSIFIRVSKEEKEAIEILAGRRGLSVSAYVRSIIMDIFYEHKKKGAGE